MEINTIFKSNSKELNDYLSRYKRDSQIESPDKSVSWKIVDVIKKTDIPPDPAGNACTQITLVVINLNEQPISSP